MEVGLIGERTKAAPAAAKARGVKLGNPNGARALRGKQIGNADAVAKIKENADQRAADPQGHRGGHQRLRDHHCARVADELHARGIRAPRGDVWHPTPVSRLLSRVDANRRNRHVRLAFENKPALPR